MKRQILFVHGRATDGSANVGVMAHEMDRRLGLGNTLRVPMEVRRISTYWGGPADGRRIARYSRPGDIIVGHSNAANGIWHAHREIEYAAILLIAPAQSQYREWRNPARTWCFHSESDRALRIGALIPFHAYGKAGIKGYRQLDSSGHNVDCTPAGHSDYFERNAWFLKICDLIELLWKM